MPDSQHIILKGCLAGDRTAQAKLYNLYSRQMLGVCMWYTRNKEEAEEVLQDGFIKAFTYLHTFSGTGSFEGWLRKIMVNAALARYRNKSSHLKPVIEFSSAMHDSAEQASVISLIDAKELVGLVQSLSPVYRVVFSLYVLEGYKHHEIATMLGIAEGTSKSNLADARAVLQKAITRQLKTAML